MFQAVFRVPRTDPLSGASCFFPCFRVRLVSDRQPLFSLPQAQRVILAQAEPLAAERVPLARALDRIAAVSLKSSTPKPSFDQSTRDGYGLADIPPDFAEYPELSLPVIGEIAAGAPGGDRLQQGQAVRIMTGAPVPGGCSRVLPFELCQEQDGRVTLAASTLRRPETHIRRRGSDLPAGRVLVRRGQAIEADHLLMLAEDGYTTIRVVRRPRVEVVCTGSELVSPGDRVGSGQKVSGNGVLLSALVRRAGAICSGTAAVADQMERLTDALAERIRRRPQVIITTGGMGPGRCDLVAEAFAALGGETVYDRLKMRPGKSTLFGRVEGILFFGLPGPPPAVYLLFHELVAPLLRRLQGMRRPVPERLSALLQEEVRLRRSGRMNLKAGLAFLEKGRLMVRVAGKTEAANAIMLLPANRKVFRVGDRVPVHLLARGL